MKKIIILAICAMLTSCAGKKVKGPCSQIESQNDLEICEFEKATVILSQAGQHVILKPDAPKAAEPAATPAKAEKKK
jgi:hypothetical protein